MVAAHKVNARSIERDPGTKSSPALRLELTPGYISGLQFQAEAVGEGITLCFFHLEQHVLFRRVALGILNCRVHFCEEAHVVEPPLAFKYLRLAERVARAQLQLAIHNKRPRKMQT